MQVNYTKRNNFVKAMERDLGWGGWEKVLAKNKKYRGNEN